MRRLMEYKATITKMPAKRFMILKRTFKKAVTKPAQKPAAAPANVASQGSRPLTRHTAQTAPPKGKLPSAVMSGKSSSLNEMSTPNATKA